MHLILWADDSEAELRSELLTSFPGMAVVRAGGMFETRFDIFPGTLLAHLAFARQLLPDATMMAADSIRAWSAQLFELIVRNLPEGQPWSLHVEPHYGASTPHRIGARAWHSLKMRSEYWHASTGGESGPPSHTPGGVKGEERRSEAVDSEAGRHRCHLIKEALLELLQKKRRQLLRQLRPHPVPFTPVDSLVQLLLTAPNRGFLSISAAPLPHEQRHLISIYPKGEVPVATDKSAPSRAFAKLLEAELRLGCVIKAGETCVDLGAAPGSWTYMAASRRAHVIAVDRSPLREDLLQNSLVRFTPGDAFGFQPERTVDWLLCDVIAPPERTAELLLKWLSLSWCRRFMVTFKLKEASALDVLNRLKRELPPLTRELFLLRLCANKKEVCAFGIT